MSGVRDQIDKKDIGVRIKMLRKQAGLRQWQLAEMIGATQPAIHMYERGVLPEPKRLLELARIGNTTVEWILTGRHSEDGSSEMHRVPEDVCRLAFQFNEFNEQDRETLEEALRILNAAVKEVREPSGSAEVLSAALGVHEAVTREVRRMAVERFRGSGFSTDEADAPATAGSDGVVGQTTGRKRRRQQVRSASLEPVRGNIFKVDGSLLVLGDLLKDKDLRSELEETLADLSGKLDSKKAKVVRLRKTQRGK
jgi:transcriptional regulator with XRE-family HTH domain